MKHPILLALTGGLFALTPVLHPDAGTVGAADQTAVAEMRGPDGDRLGTVTFAQGANGLVVQARLEGLPEGAHAFHIHETGACAPDFSAAGGHYAPKGNEHGIHNEQGRHAGDLPNIHAGEDGTAKADFFVERLSLGTLGDTTLFDGDGSAVIVHENPDSYGAEAGAGGRIACGVITRP